MDAANLHRWARENGKSYWNTGHYQQAVMQAAIRINAKTQAKLSRMDVSETALFNEAFSLGEPKEGVPRLRLMENDGSKTYENLHRGARAFAGDALCASPRGPGPGPAPPHAPLRCLSFAPAHVCTSDEDTRAGLVVVAHLGRDVEELGLYAAIRNPGMHVPHDGGEEQLGLEQLAAFSLLARWVDQADVLSV